MKKITKRQLRRIIREAAIGADEYRASVRLDDDSGPVVASISVEGESVLIRFGNSFTLRIDGSDAAELGDAIAEAGDKALTGKQGVRF